MGRKSIPRPRLSIRFAQNFLKEASLVTALIHRTDLDAKDTVYEIGPGRGIITEALSKVCGRVVAIEFERGLALLLQKRFADHKNVEIVKADVLQFQFPAVPYKVFSNIPFNVTADILKKLLSGGNPPVSAYLILQREAAEKYLGARGTRQVSLLLHPWYEMRILYKFNRSDFEPVPGVDVVLLHVQKRESPLVGSADADLYRQLIIYGFSRQRSSLGKSYKKIFSHLQWKRLAQDLGFDIHAQPTELGFDQWLGIFRFFIQGTRHGFARIPPEMLASPSSGMSSSDGAKSTRGLRYQRWKNVKAKRER